MGPLYKKPVAVHFPRQQGEARAVPAFLSGLRGSLYWISRGYPPSYPLVPGPKLSNSREQVLGDLRQWKQRPVSADGKRDLGGEIGWTEDR